MTPVLAIAHGAPPSRPVSERFEKKKKLSMCAPDCPGSVGSGRRGGGRDEK